MSEQEQISYLLLQLADRDERLRRCRNERYRLRVSRDLWRHRALRKKR